MQFIRCNIAVALLLAVLWLAIPLSAAAADLLPEPVTTGAAAQLVKPTAAVDAATLSNRWVAVVPQIDEASVPDASISDTLRVLKRDAARRLPALDTFDGVVTLLGILLLALAAAILLYDFVDLTSIGISTRATKRVELLRELRVLR